MKILVDEMPKTVRDCFFSQRSNTGEFPYYVCALRPYIEKASAKPICLCKSVALCDRLKPIEEVNK